MTAQTTPRPSTPDRTGGETERSFVRTFFTSPTAVEGEATYQAVQTPISLFQDVYEHRPD